MKQPEMFVEEAQPIWAETVIKMLELCMGQSTQKDGI